MNSNITVNKFPWLIIFALFCFPFSQVSGLSTPTLTEAPGARSIGVGEAFSAAQDDVTATHFNPAALSTLKQGQASFFYDRGLANDVSGRFMTGIPHRKWGAGLSVAYFEEGILEFYDVNTVQNLEGRKELTLGLSASRSFSGIHLGLTGKYVSSQIIEGVSGQVWAVDVGLLAPLGPRALLGMSLQNLGPNLQFADGSTSLPRTARLGVSLPVSFSQVKNLIFVDSVYDSEAKLLSPALGWESQVGPLALRGGLQIKESQWDYSLGTGFAMGRLTMDYALALAPQMDAQHNISVSVKFGGVEKTILSQSNRLPIQTAPSPGEATLNVPTFSPSEPTGWTTSAKSQSYIVQPKDTWESIALRFYRDQKAIQQLKVANQHFVDTKKEPLVGQKILLP